MPITWVYEEIVLAAALVVRNDWRGLDDLDVPVIELSALLNRARFHPFEGRDQKFRNPNGVARKTWDIATRHPDYTGTPTKGNRLDVEVLKLFLRDGDRMRAEAQAIRDAVEEGVEPLPDSDPDLVHAAEGRILLSRHVRRERNSKLRARKIAAVRVAGGTLACEVCGFDFEMRYGERGSGYVEVHHVLPLHVSGVVRTRLSDLAILCSNCHRMMHRQPWTTPEELRSSLSKARGAFPELNDYRVGQSRPPVGHQE
jgi:5-methylcytosine-specific restriction protein A